MKKVKVMAYDRDDAYKKVTDKYPGYVVTKSLIKKIKRPYIFHLRKRKR